MKKYLKALVIGFFIVSKCFAQYEPGDTIPKDWLRQVLTIADPGIQDSSWVGKHIIIDFWAINCGTCISSMPKVKEIQDKYSSKLKVVYLHHNTQKAVDSFFNKRSFLKMYLLPIGESNEAINSAFPHNGVPHVVWINPDGKVQAITYGSDFVEANVAKWIKNGDISLGYVARKLDYDFNKPFFGSWPEGDLPVFKSATLVGGIPGVRSITWTNTLFEGKLRRDSKINTTLRGLFSTAARKLAGISMQEIHCRIIGDDYFDSLSNLNRLYCFEYIEPDSISGPFEDITLIRQTNALSNLLGLKYEFVEQELDCYELRLPESKGDTTYTIHTALYSNQYNQSIASIARALQYVYRLDHPIVAPIGDSRKCNLFVSVKDKNFDHLRESIVAQGGELVPVVRRLTVMKLTRSNGL